MKKALHVGRMVLIHASIKKSRSHQPLASRKARVFERENEAADLRVLLNSGLNAVDSVEAWVLIPVGRPKRVQSHSRGETDFYGDAVGQQRALRVDFHRG